MVGCRQAVMAIVWAPKRAATAVDCCWSFWRSRRTMFTRFVGSRWTRGPSSRRRVSAASAAAATSWPAGPARASPEYRDPMWKRCSSVPLTTRMSGNWFRSPGDRPHQGSRIGGQMGSLNSLAMIGMDGRYQNAARGCLTGRFSVNVFSDYFWIELKGDDSLHVCRPTASTPALRPVTTS